jgi:Pyruvate/2-oxoacid:ferredoxin oxidoreductase delta subunit
MAKRNIVKIDTDKCTGCGVCIKSCAEGAIQLIDGKARLVSDIYCDGLGACLGTCPEDAITIEVREAAEFDESLVPGHAAHGQATSAHNQHKSEGDLPCGCPGTAVRTLKREPSCSCSDQVMEESQSALAQWPVQLKLVPPTAPYLKGADLLLTADCVPFALADYHERYLRGRAVLIGCPKLDDSQFYVEKLSDIIQTAGLASIKVLRMEVPCCSGLTRIVELAIENSRVRIPFDEVIISIEGRVLQDTAVATR